MVFLKGKILLGRYKSLPLNKYLTQKKVLLKVKGLTNKRPRFCQVVEV
jgi:hypothetical protein